MTTQSHHDHVEKQFSSQASEYLTSTVHASGRDLQRLAVRLADYPDASVLDMGCGAGHASFVAAQNVSAVVAYDLSAQMLDVVAQAAEARQLKNITTRQGYAESLPFADNAFDIVISRYSAHHWHDVGAALREVNRVLKPGGRLIVMDVMSPGHPVRDIWLQTVEALRDTSHVRNYTSGECGFAPIFPDTCYHLTHYWLAAVDIPVASDNPVHYADAIRYNARTPLQGSLLPLTRLVWA